MHVCQPWTNVPKIHHKTSDPKIFISHICFELCRNSSPRMWANPEPTTQDTLKTSDPRIFISHIPVLNFAGAALHITPCMCANPEQTFQRYTTKPQTLRFSSHTSVLNFAGPRMWANPSWTNVPRHTTKPQTQKFSSHTSLFWTLLEQLSILHHACVPTLNQRSKDAPQNLRPSDFHLTHPCFELCRNSSPCCTTNVSQPILNQRPKTHHKTSNPKIFISHIPLLNFARAALHITPCMCANPEPTIQRYTAKPQTLRFSSHTSVLNFAGTALHVTPRMWANPSWTNDPRHTKNFRSENFHLTHSCFELCRSSSLCLPYYTTHVFQPWTNVPKMHHKTSDPPIFISHIPVLNFAGTALHVTPRMWAKAILDSAQTTNDSILQTHPHPTSQDTLLKIPMFTL